MEGTQPLGPPASRAYGKSNIKGFPLEKGFASVQVKFEHSSDQASDHWSGTGAANQDSVEALQFEDLRPDNRMARKAELARESRKRKKVYIQNLQEKAKRYQAKVEQLEKRQARFLSTLGLNGGGRDEQNRRLEQMQLLKRMATELEDTKKPQGEKREEIKKLLEAFTSNSRNRQHKISGLVDKVKDCLTPGLQAKYALWLLTQDERFYDESKFWPSLAYQEIGITADQAEKLKANKKLMTERREELNRTLNDLEMLRDRAVRHVNSLNEAIDRMQSHLNPEQQAKFAVWVAK